MGFTELEVQIKRIKEVRKESKGGEDNMGFRQRLYTLGQKRLTASTVGHSCCFSPVSPTDNKPSITKDPKEFAESHF